MRVLDIVFRQLGDSKDRVDTLSAEFKEANHDNEANGLTTCASTIESCMGYILGVYKYVKEGEGVTNGTETVQTNECGSVDDKLSDQSKP
jgi:hypothetical protein